MKSFIITIIFVTTVNFFVTAQSVKISNDTVTYGNSKFYPSKQVQILYGSQSNKGFAFVFVGTGFSTDENNITTPLFRSLSKGVVTIKRTFKLNGKWYAQGLMNDIAQMATNPITIDVEGAIDNKEIKED
jgi:hypothetical protein